MSQIEKELIGRSVSQEDMAQKTPKYEFLSKEKTKEMLQLFKGERTGWVLVGPEKYFFPYRYTEQGSGFYNFKARPDDTWVASYPRSGLHQSIIYHHQRNISEKNDLFISKYFFAYDNNLKTIVTIFLTNSQIFIT